MVSDPIAPLARIVPLPSSRGPAAVPAPATHRIAVFTADPGYSVRKGIVEIDRTIPGLSWLIVHHRPRRTRKQVARNQWNLLKRNGWRWIPYQAGAVWKRLAERRAAVPVPAEHPGGDYTSEALAARTNIRILRVPDIHGQASLDAIREFDPDLGLAISAPILRPPVFTSPRRGSLTLHKGKAPDYRGMPPAFWELWNDEKEVGCTIQVVAEKLDAGDIVGRGSVPCGPHSTVRGITLRLDEVGVDLMRDAVRDTLAGTSHPEIQTGRGKTYRKPTLGQIAALEGKLARAQPPRRSPAVRAVKDSLFGMGHAAWRAGLGKVLAPRITVLLYHRVTDDARDDLTVGVEQFDRQMALLRRHCQVLTIDQVLNASEIDPAGKPQVAVTFDDGYLDNHDNAAPILERHGIPAAFFVSTGLIGTAAQFPHDVRRGNAPIPLMTWDHLRAMRDSGFEIGSHTVGHTSCASGTDEEIRSELERSRDDLQRELGVVSPIFAYPYGGRQHMTPGRLELVKQAGYRGCLAAYGGSNVARVDRFNVLRRGIHWEYSDRAFLFECLGVR
ncbi:MAG: polysaccharide deacetylase family protein [Deltaproteobacteria bacterium]